MFSSLLAKILGKSFFEFLAEIWDAFVNTENAKKAKEYDVLIKSTNAKNAQVQDIREKRITEIGLTDSNALQKPKPVLTEAHKKQIEMALRYRNGTSIKDLADFDAETKRLKDEKEAKLKRIMIPQDDPPPAA